MYAPFKSNASMYRNVGVHTGIEAAGPHQLVTMLFDGALAEIATARGELRNPDPARKCQSISKAVRIVDEGLKAALNPQAGEIASNLGNLYTYVVARLTQGNLKNDDAALGECAALIGQVRDGWVSMPPAARAA
jgi:flagellar protein FliS